MKRILIVAGLLGMATLAQAEGYAGAVRALSNINHGCETGLQCDHSAKGLKFYVGSSLAPERVRDLGVAKVDAVEVSYLKFGEVRSAGVAANGNNVGAGLQADALALAAAAHAPLFQGATASARLGAAWVTSTQRETVNGVGSRAVSASKLQPYVGLGLEYDVENIVKVVASADFTRFDAGGSKATMRLLGVGAEKSF